MSEIAIQRPILLKIEVVEVDDYLPSMKLFVNLDIEHPTGFLKYQAADIWLECSKWDSFVSKLALMSFQNDDEATLSDMSNYFCLGVETEGGQCFFRCEVQEQRIGEGTATLQFKFKIDDDVLSHLKESFDSFPKWW